MRPAHTLLTFEGVLGSVAAPSETWGFGLRATGGLEGAAANLESAASLAMGAWSDTLRAQMGSQLVLTRTSVATVNADEHWGVNPDGSYQVGRWEGSIAGSNTTENSLPAQSAVVVSLNTARSGPSGKGRIFLPLGRANLDTDGRLLPAKATAIADAAQAFINNLNTFVGAIAVVSSKGYSSPVTAVRVGRVVDTQRSRRRSQVEEYVFRSLPS